MQTYNSELITNEKKQFNAAVDEIYKRYSEISKQFDDTLNAITRAQNGIRRLEAERKNRQEQEEKIPAEGWVGLVGLMAVDIFIFDGAITNKIAQARLREANQRAIYEENIQDATQLKESLISQLIPLIAELLAVKKGDPDDYCKIPEDEINRAQINFKIKYPYLHQVNLLDVNTRVSRDIDKLDVQYQLINCLTEQEFTDDKKQLLLDIKLVLTKTQKSQFLKSKGLITGFFNARLYEDYRITALKALLSNPFFEKLSALEQINLLRNEIISVENRNNMLLQFVHDDGVSPLPAVGNLLTSLVTRSNPELEKFITAIKDLNPQLLNEVTPNETSENTVSLLAHT